MRNPRPFVIGTMLLSALALIVAGYAVYSAATAGNDDDLQGTVSALVAEHDTTQHKVEVNANRVKTIFARVQATSNEEVGNLRKQLSTAKTTLVTLMGRVERAERKMEHYDYCLPELRNESRSVTFNGQEYGEADGYLTNGYLTHSKEVSRFCIDLFTDAQSNRVQEGSGD